MKFGSQESIDQSIDDSIEQSIEQSRNDSNEQSVDQSNLYAAEVFNRKAKKQLDEIQWPKIGSWKFIPNAFNRSTK